jgi:hypothetical protein
MARDRVRDEAERLVAAAITAVSLAARGMGAAGRGSNLANGSPECCVCPVCRVIATMRDPSADLAERLASGAGDLATAVASMLRTLSRTSGHTDEGDRERTREGDEFWESLRRRANAEATAWRARATTARADGVESEEDTADPWRAATTAPAGPAKPMAKKAVAKKTVATKVAPASPRAAERPEPAPGPETTGASAPVAKKAVKKAAKAAPAKAADGGAPAKAAPAKAAKKAVKKAVPPPADFG